jgi:hypothetical protein
MAFQHKIDFLLALRTDSFLTSDSMKERNFFHGMTD